MELKTMKVQNVKGSFFVYIPKLSAEQIKLKKGDNLTWYIDENDHSTIKLRKKEIYKLKDIKEVG